VGQDAVAQPLRLNQLGEDFTGTGVYAPGWTSIGVRRAKNGGEIVKALRSR